MTENWADAPVDHDDPEAAEHAGYPEYPTNPHNHLITISFTGDKAPMVVVRGNMAVEINRALADLEDAGAYAALGKAHSTLRGVGAMGAQLGATPVPPAPYAAPPQPSTPAYGAPAPAYGAPAPAAPAQGGYGGYAGGGAPAGGKAQPKPCPPGWLKIDNSHNRDGWKNMRANNGEYLRGKIQWGGAGTYWISPEVAQFIAQNGFQPVAA